MSAMVPPLAMFAPTAMGARAARGQSNPSEAEFSLAEMAARWRGFAGDGAMLLPLGAKAG
ncbi:MAG: hypothetical protein CMN18_10505 [Roseovarius sp.]|nr:hypothetical protein [Roseovarius sp.]MBD13133.1 hypothetical protein [Roseovarius sp.]